MRTEAEGKEEPRTASTELAVETLKEIARNGYGSKGTTKERHARRRSKDEIITMAREACDELGINWDRIEI
jgi:hypothetical protein